MRVVDDPAAVVVAEDRVVEGRQEPHGGRGVGIGPRRVGEVEQLAAALVVEGDQLGADGRDGGGQPGQTAPGPQVGRRRGPVGREVPTDEPLPDGVGPLRECCETW
ncbi:hypothetical protein GCM10023403_60400 [Pseudonocardia benzenivorans]